jgi:hypothetical protein
MEEYMNTDEIDVALATLKARNDRVADRLGEVGAKLRETTVRLTAIFAEKESVEREAAAVWHETEVLKARVFSGSDE